MGKEGKTNYKESCVELAKITQCVFSAYFRGEDANNAELRKESEGSMRGRQKQERKGQSQP